jgi:hypothetical protein
MNELLINHSLFNSVIIIKNIKSQPSLSALIQQNPLFSQILPKSHKSNLQDKLYNKARLLNDKPTIPKLLLNSVYAINIPLWRESGFRQEGGE